MIYRYDYVMNGGGWVSGSISMPFANIFYQQRAFLIF